MNIIQRIIEFILQLLGNKSEETSPSVPAQPPTQPEPSKPTVEQSIPFDNLKQSVTVKKITDLPLKNPPAQNITAPEWSQINHTQPIPFDPIKEM